MEDFDATARAVVDQFERSMGPQGKAKAKPKAKVLGKAKAKGAPEPLTAPDVDRAFEARLKDCSIACSAQRRLGCESISIGAAVDSGEGGWWWGGRDEED